MTLFEDFTRRFSETAKVAAKKSGELVEVAKLNLGIVSEEEKIKKEYIYIGKLIYEMHTEEEELPEGFSEHCERIDSYEDSIKELKLKIYKIKNIKLCPSCNTEIEKGFKFCPKCGAKQPAENETIVEKKKTDSKKTESKKTTAKKKPATRNTTAKSTTKSTAKKKQ